MLAGNGTPTSTTRSTMGDKSPKSKQKNKDQKQGKANASANDKQRAIDAKRQAETPPGKKKG